MFESIKKNINIIDACAKQIFSKIDLFPDCFCLIETKQSNSFVFIDINELKTFHNFQSAKDKDLGNNPRIIIFGELLIPTILHFLGAELTINDESTIYCMACDWAPNFVLSVGLKFQHPLNHSIESSPNISFLGSLVHTFLDKSQSSIISSNFLRNYFVQEVMITAGDHFVKDVIHEVSGLKNISLFDIFNQITLNHYEENEPTGTIIFCKNSEVDNHCIFRFVQPFDIKDLRGLRKLIEMSSEQIGIICDGEKIFGLGKNTKTNSFYTVNIAAQGLWSLQKDGNILIQVTYGIPDFPSPKLSKSDFRIYFSKIFNIFLEEDFENIWQIVSVAISQPKGTNILITTLASSEALRLSTQATLVEPFLLTPELAFHVTGVDGTVILDNRGYCYALSAILDGKVSANGQRQRGGRYNSAVMYYEQSTNPCLILVVSQDGDINLIPPI